jgi:hypothetical protein
MSTDNLKLICSFLNSSRREAIYACGISKRARMFYFQLERNNARIAWKIFKSIFVCSVCIWLRKFLFIHRLYCVNICHSYQIVACYGFLTPVVREDKYLKKCCLFTELMGRLAEYERWKNPGVPRYIRK